MKVLFVLFRRPGLSHEQCLTEWSGERHTSIVTKTPGLTRWVQNHVGTLPSDAMPDGIGELWFDSPGALESPEMAAAAEDAERFLDMERTYALVVVEKRVLG
jgi:uncharacterized protein (TIGR02118 family)